MKSPFICIEFLIGSISFKSIEIILFGADFCLINQQTHSSSEKNKEQINANIYDKDLLNGNGEIVKTKPSLISFLRELELYISKRNDITFINSSTVLNFFIFLAP